jgi:hypothetical protein
MPYGAVKTMYPDGVLDQVPVLVIPCVQGRMESVPMIAAREPALFPPAYYTGDDAGARSNAG